MADYIRGVVGTIYEWLPPLPPASAVTEKVIIKEIPTEMLPQRGLNFVRLAGLSGAVAVGMGAYGAHVFRQGEAEESLKLTFETGNRYHMMHTLALLAVPLTRRPMLVGTSLAMGTLLFSGSCYYHALTGDTRIRKVTPYGGMLLIFAWLSIAF